MADDIYRCGSGGCPSTRINNEWSEKCERCGADNWILLGSVLEHYVTSKDYIAELDEGVWELELYQWGRPTIAYLDVRPKEGDMLIGYSDEVEKITILGIIDADEGMERYEDDEE